MPDNPAKYLFCDAMQYHKNIICPYCRATLTRYKKLKEHIEEIHPGEEVPGWVIKEANK